MAAGGECDVLIGALLKRNGDLEARVVQNSRNSTRPPSSDGYAKAKSPSRAEQKAAGRKPGKQPGAPGKHLARVPDPDEVSWPLRLAAVDAGKWARGCPGLGVVRRGGY